MRPLLSLLVCLLSVGSVLGDYNVTIDDDSDRIRYRPIGGDNGWVLSKTTNTLKGTKHTVKAKNATATFVFTGAIAVRYVGFGTDKSSDRIQIDLNEATTKVPTKLSEDDRPKAILFSRTNIDADTIYTLTITKLSDEDDPPVTVDAIILTIPGSPPASSTARDTQIFTPPASTLSFTGIIDTSNVFTPGPDIATETDILPSDVPIPTFILTDSGTGSGNRLNLPAIIGGAVGGGVLVILLSVLFFWWGRRRGVAAHREKIKRALSLPIPFLSRPATFQTQVAERPIMPTKATSGSHYSLGQSLGSSGGPSSSRTPSTLQVGSLQDNDFGYSQRSLVPSSAAIISYPRHLSHVTTQQSSMPPSAHTFGTRE